MMKKVLTKELIAKLTKAGYANMNPICKLYIPWGVAKWLITGMEDGILYGYTDLGEGNPLGYAEWGGHPTPWGAITSLEKIEAIQGPFGMKIKRDRYWTPKEGENYCERE